MNQENKSHSRAATREWDSKLQRLQEFRQVFLFLIGQLQFEMLVIVNDDFVQRLESPIVIEAALLVGPQPAQRRGPVLSGWGAGSVEIINPDLSRRVQA